jgi:gamma-glutamylcyclotransferase (GGCT)/AIG2-like uncharacterized protein YtfP
LLFFSPTIAAPRKRERSVARIISSGFLERDSLLFVYGTLRPSVDIPMARWLARMARYVGPGCVRGRLYDLGAYPGLKAPRRSDEWVAGDLYSVRKPRVLHALDRYEADGRGRPRFVRRNAVVRLGRREHEAWVYVYRLGTLRQPRISHGDYLAHVARR